MNPVLIVAYLIALVAVTAANLITTEVGPEASVYTAFFLIAADFVARDLIHDYAGRRRWIILGSLIVAGSAISYAINSDAAQIAKASAAAFGAALVVDTLIYQLVHRRPWLERSNISNVFAAAVDSAVFVAVAFPGAFLWDIAFGQLTAKVAGGVLFSIALLRLRERFA
jgi:uncharacterized PurR-regulated membrane protein YhhQ (DUF165 family)